MMLISRQFQLLLMTSFHTFR